MAVYVGSGADKLARAMGVPDPEGVRKAVLTLECDAIATLTVERFATDDEIAAVSERYVVSERLVDVEAR